MSPLTPRSHLPYFKRNDIGQALFSGLKRTIEELSDRSHAVEYGIPVDIHLLRHGFYTASVFQIHSQRLHIFRVLLPVGRKKRMNRLLCHLLQKPAFSLKYFSASYASSIAAMYWNSGLLRYSISDMLGYYDSSNFPGRHSRRITASLRLIIEKLFLKMEIKMTPSAHCKRLRYTISDKKSQRSVRKEKIKVRGAVYREPDVLIIICATAPKAYTTSSGVKVIPVGCLRD